jgi:hypothetical protein
MSRRLIVCLVASLFVGAVLLCAIVRGRAGPPMRTLSAQGTHSARVTTTTAPPLPLSASPAMPPVIYCGVEDQATNVTDPNSIGVMISAGHAPAPAQAVAAAESLMKLYSANPALVVVPTNFVVVNPSATPGGDTWVVMSPVNPPLPQGKYFLQVGAGGVPMPAGLSWPKYQNCPWYGPVSGFGVLFHWLGSAQTSNQAPLLRRIGSTSWLSDGGGNAATLDFEFSENVQASVPIGNLISISGQAMNCQSLTEKAFVQYKYTIDAGATLTPILPYVGQHLRFDCYGLDPSHAVTVQVASGLTSVRGLAVRDITDAGTPLSYQFTMNSLRQWGGGRSYIPGGTNACVSHGGSSCTFGTDCCSTSDMCSATNVCCAGAAGPCGQTSDCCAGASLDCESGICCKGAGIGCGTNAECCGSFVCLNGVCSTCVADKGACSVASTCCSGVCSGTGACCSWLGQDCSQHGVSDCCTAAAGTADAGFIGCAPSVDGGPRCCLRTAGPCQSGQDCCSNTCISGSCT